jgi:penicillin-binding protein 1A
MLLRGLWRLLGRATGLGLRALGLVIVAGVVALLWFHVEIVPEIDARLMHLRDYRPPTQVRVLDREGKELDAFHVERREWVPIEELPDWIGLAVVAAEDRRFFEHPGLDLLGTARAALANARAGTIREGGSTLTQQLIKNLVVGDEKSYERKLREAAYALRLEHLMSKDEILELYLNYVYLGSGNYGVEAASQDYFGVSARQLDAGQAALLAGLIPSPSRYSPRRNPETAGERRQLVLSSMVEMDHLNGVEAGALARAEVAPPRGGRAREDGGAAYRTAVRREVRRLLGSELPYVHGLVIHTAHDAELQATVDEAVTAAVEAVRQRQARRGDGADPARVQGAVVVIENRSGAVVAMSGGLGMELEGFNRATQARRQPGSSFKPYVYAAALEGGRTQLSTVVDAPLSLPAGGGKTWSPRNYGGGYSGQLPMHRALARSVNTVAVRLALESSPEAVGDVARRLGVASPIRDDLTIALGSSEVTVLDQAVAYSALARMGEARAPVFIERLVDVHGDEVGRAGTPVELGGGEIAVLPGAGAQTMDPAVAYQVIDMLRGVIRSGTARKAHDPDLDRAGKTGTTSDFIDAWFVGCTPGHTIAVWVGADDRTSLGAGETGGRAALPAWITIADALVAPGARFPIPDDVLLVRDGNRWAGVPREDASAGLPTSTDPLPDFPGAS